MTANRQQDDTDFQRAARLLNLRLDGLLEDALPQTQIWKLMVAAVAIGMILVAIGSAAGAGLMAFALHQAGPVP